MSDEQEFNFEPWSELKDMPPDTMGRLADIIGAKTEEGKPAFGKSGIAVAKELRQWISWREAVKKKRTKPTIEKKKKPIEQKDDPITMGARDIAKHMHGQYKAVLGIPFPDEFMATWKRVEKFCRGSQWRDVEEIKDLFMDWVESGKSITIDSGSRWIFGKGGTFDFLYKLAQLKLLRQGGEVAQSEANRVPLAMLIKWEEQGKLPDKYRTQYNKAMAKN
jgi:hypothetical protein